MALKAIIPTLGGEREEMLNKTVELFQEHGFETIVIRDNTTGGGHYVGLNMCQDTDYVLMAGDDVQVKDLSKINLAKRRADLGQVVAPRLWKPNGAQSHTAWQDSLIVWLTEFPFALASTFWKAYPWPHTNHFCDSWISEWANREQRGPVVTNGFEFTHLVQTPVTDQEREEYTEWVRLRLQPKR